MATGQFFNPPLRHIGKATSSGTFVIPQTVSKIFVTVVGSRGGASNQGNAQPGASIAAGGFVEVLPGSTATITIGAGGVTNSQSGTTAGTTSFDGSISVTGSAGGGYDTRYGATPTGATGTRTYDSSLPTGYPSGAIARVSGTTTTGPTGDVGVASSGFILIYA